MIGAVFLVLFLFFASQPILDNLQKEHKWLKAGLLNQMYWYHMLFGLVYWTYAQFNRSDSVNYFNSHKWYDNWFETFSPGTLFIEWVNYPFAKWLGFNYDMMMFLSTWVGFWGFAYFYCFMKENLRFNPKFEGWDAITIFMFLPNMQRMALHDVQAQFTIIYFWDSECIHCVRVTPQLRDMVKQFSPEQVQVFAVNIESDMQAWLNAVNSYQIGHWINVNDTGNITGYREAYNLIGVPTIFLLDAQKRIVAKMISVEQIQEIIKSKI